MKRVAVIGGGVAGMQTALRLAEQGVEPVIIEKEAELGGKLRGWHVLFPSFTPAQEVLTELRRRVNEIGIEDQGLAQKLSSIVSGYIALFIKQLIGYDLTAYTRGTAQSDNTKFGLFAMFTIIPFITTSLGIIPMLFYDLNDKKKEKMYEELLERRAAMSKEATSGDLEALEKLAKAQMEIGNSKSEL